jgi:hypothetical protein
LFLYPPYRFVGEEVSLTLNGLCLEVSGTYYFENLTDKRVRAILFYPFPLSSYEHYPEWIEVYGADFREVQEGIVLEFNLDRRAFGVIRVEYEQSLDSLCGRYILTTTKSWREPLDWAIYEVRVPKDVSEVHISLPILEVHEDSLSRLFRSTFFKFLPKRDLVVTLK